MIGSGGSVIHIFRSTRALALLVYARLLLSVFPLERVKRSFLPARPGSFDNPDIDGLLEAVEAASWRFRSLNSCLPRSLVICRLLREAGVDAELHLGANTKAAQFEAHAWVEDTSGRRFDRPGAQAGDYIRFDDL